MPPDRYEVDPTEIKRILRVGLELAFEDAPMPKWGDEGEGARRSVFGVNAGRRCIRLGRVDSGIVPSTGQLLPLFDFLSNTLKRRRGRCRLCRWGYYV